MFSITAGVKIKFEYELDDLFDNVSLDTLTHASKMVDAKGEDQTDNYGMVDEERSTFNQFVSEGAIKVFQKLVKMTSGIVDSFRISLTGSAAIKQKETISFSGAGGMCGITGAGGISKTLTLGGGNTDIVMAINVFVTSNYLAYETKGINIYLGPDETLVFESMVAGVAFVPPVTSSYGDLTGTVDHTTANATSVKTVSFEIKDKASYNANYLPIIDEEINLALMNFVMKEWFAKCNLGELTKYYAEKYNENIRMIIRNSISLRKPSFS